MKQSRLFFFLLIVSFSMNGLALELTIAPLCDGNPKTKSQEALDAGKIIGNVYQINSIITKRCVGWTNMGSGNIWYDVYPERIISVNVENKALLGNWPLATQNLCNPDEDESCSLPWWHGRWSADELLETDIIGQYYGTLGWNDLSAEVSQIDFMGCMQRTPLRYGDIEGDGQSELVILLPNLYSVDWLIFSPTLGKTIFAVKLDYNDVMPVTDLKEYMVHFGDSKKRYQYYSRWQADMTEVYPDSQGYRSIAKLYVNDFDKDGHSDILVWRKMYESRLVGDPLSGFKLNSQLYGHYALIDGEYHLQQTDEATIQGWLSANELTWQKGYPSSSECQGHEGELIPEMHDPLLNDPDVLK